MDHTFKTWLNSMPAFWIMLTGALLVLLWALASGFPLGGWLLAFVVTVFVGQLVSSLLGSIGLALYAVLVFIALVAFSMS